MTDRAVICVGNRSRSDDAVGPLIAEALARDHPDVPLHLSGGEPGELFDLWSGLTRVVLVDAVVTRRSEAGQVHVLQAATQPLPVVSHASSHGIGLAETIELARALSRLPPDVRVVGIEAGSLDPGAELTPAVEEALPRAIAQVLEEVGDA